MPEPNLSNHYSEQALDPDVFLMLEFQKGDKASFENLMRKYYKRVFNFIYRFVGSIEIAEDLTQEVFMKVYKKAPSYKPQAKFQTWLYTIAKNISLNELRKHKKKMISLEETIESDSGEIKRQFEDDTSENPFQRLENKELVAIIKKAINQLPENQRIAVLLHRYEQFSYEEIAQTMGCSVSAVKSLLSRAKENLKIVLSQNMNI